MRKLIVSMNVTLNGFMAGRHGELDWHMPYWNQEIANALTQQLGNADTLILGRNTYQAMAPYWQAQLVSFNASREDADFAEMINRCEKVVFSKTLSHLNWCNSRPANRNISKEINWLKKQPGKDLLVYGSGKLVTALNRLNLIDEYRLWVHPVAIKAGRPLFKSRINLQPYKIKAFNSGIVLMYFEVR